MLKRVFNSNAFKFTRKFSTRKYKFFDNVEIKNNIALIRINGPDKMNVLDRNLFTDVYKLFENEIFGKKEIKGVVFLSSKPDNFIAGADVDMLKNTKNKKEMKEILMNGNLFFEEIKKKHKLPLVSAINGACFGGGLEWALFCDYRIASNNKITKLGLPEVTLGLMPGMGGTYHLPKLIGLPNSLDMILTGKRVDANKAKKLGFVDEVVEEYELEGTAINIARQLSVGKKFKKRNLTIYDHLEKIGLFRNYIFSEAKKNVDKATGGKMPGPYKIIETMKENYGKSKMDYLNAEAESFSELSETNESDALISLFKGSKFVKKHNFGEKMEVNNLSVIGAGLMGTGITHVSLVNGGYNVNLKDTNEENVKKSKDTIIKDLSSKLKKGKISKSDYDNKVSKLALFHEKSNNFDKLNNSDIIIEAVFEDIKVKHKIINDLEEDISKSTIIASNTSAIPISSIAACSKRSENIIGMHYFSPVQKMPLIEIIPHERTSNKVISTAMNVSSKQGKTPILVKDVPGFYVNRCLAPLLVELPEIIMSGVELNSIEKAMKDFGMPVGPLTLSDEVGIDISKHVTDFMSNADLGVRMKGDYSLISDMVEKGFLGRKSGKGFYKYKGKSKELNEEVIKLIKTKLNGIEYGSNKMCLEEIQMRLIGKFINEAAYCLQDEIIRSPVDGDIGAVFGIGFPPHTGGPFKMLDLTGVSNFVEKMSKLEEKYGKQFKPANILVEYSKLNKKFYN